MLGAASLNSDQVGMVGIGAVIWQQRAAIEAKVKKCQLDMTFMGIHVHAPADVQAQCKSVTR